MLKTLAALKGANGGDAKATSSKDSLGRGSNGSFLNDSYEQSQDSIAAGDPRPLGQSFMDRQAIYASGDIMNLNDIGDNDGFMVDYSSSESQGLNEGDGDNENENDDGEEENIGRRQKGNNSFAEADDKTSATSSQLTINSKSTSSLNINGSKSNLYSTGGSFTNLRKSSKSSKGRKTSTSTGNQRKASSSSSTSKANAAPITTITAATFVRKNSISKAAPISKKKSTSNASTSSSSSKKKGESGRNGGKGGKSHPPMLGEMNESPSQIITSFLHLEREGKKELEEEIGKSSQLQLNNINNNNNNNNSMGSTNLSASRVSISISSFKQSASRASGLILNASNNNIATSSTVAAVSSSPLTGQPLFLNLNKSLEDELARQENKLNHRSVTGSNELLLQTTAPKARLRANSLTPLSAYGDSNNVNYLLSTTSPLLANASNNTSTPAIPTNPGSKSNLNYNTLLGADTSNIVSVNNSTSAASLLFRSRASFVGEPRKKSFSTTSSINNTTTTTTKEENSEQLIINKVNSEMQFNMMTPEAQPSSTSSSNSKGKPTISPDPIIPNSTASPRSTQSKLVLNHSSSYNNSNAKNAISRQSSHSAAVPNRTIPLKHDNSILTASPPTLHRLPSTSATHSGLKHQHSQHNQQYNQYGQYGQDKNNRTLFQLINDFPKLTLSERHNFMLLFLSLCDQNDMKYLYQVLPNLHRNFLGLLPATLSYHILSFLHPQNLINVSMVCRGWKALLGGDFLWSYLLRLINVPLVPQVNYWDGQIARNAFKYYLAKNWTSQSYQEMRIDPHDESVLSICLAYPCIITGSADRMIKIFDISSTTTNASKSATFNTSVSNSQLMSSATSASIKCLGTLEGHEDDVTCLQYIKAPNCEDQPAAIGGLIISGSSDRSIKVWNLESMTLITSLSGHSQGITCISAKDDIIISGSSDKTIRIWQIVFNANNSANTGAKVKSNESHYYASTVQSVTCQRILRGHTNGIRSLQFDKDIILSASHDQQVRIWHLSTGNLLQSININYNGLCCMFYDSVRRFVLFGTFDGTVHVWDVLEKPGTTTSNINSGGNVADDGLDPSPDEREEDEEDQIDYNDTEEQSSRKKTLNSSSKSTTKKSTTPQPLFNSNNNNNNNTNNQNNSHLGIIKHYRKMSNWSRDSHIFQARTSYRLHKKWVLDSKMDDWRLISAGADGVIQIYHVMLDRPILTLEEHAGKPFTSFDYDDRALVAGSVGGSVYIWDFS